MLADILTLDNLYHALAAIGLVVALSYVGAWGVPTGVALLFLCREMEQAAAKGERWKPWLWSWHKHAEWIAPTVAAIVAFLIFA